MSKQCSNCRYWDQGNNGHHLFKICDYAGEEFADFDPDGKGKTAVALSRADSELGRLYTTSNHYCNQYKKENE